MKVKKLSKIDGVEQKTEYSIYKIEIKDSFEVRDGEYKNLGKMVTTYRYDGKVNTYSLDKFLFLNILLNSKGDLGIYLNACKNGDVESFNKIESIFVDVSEGRLLTSSLQKFNYTNYKKLVIFDLDMVN